MIHFSHRGNFEKTVKFLTKVPDINYQSILERYGRFGVDALANATPIDTGETKSSWAYEVKKTKSGYNLIFTNSHLAGSVPVIILLQYGHGTRNGAFIEGKDIINPVMKPIFDTITDNIWKEVSSL